jgi:hypothetical protein
MTTANLTGIVRGNAIELDQPSGLVEGQRVVIDVIEVQTSPTGEGIRQSAGAWGDAGSELDQWLQQTYLARQAERLSGSP